MNLQQMQRNEGNINSTTNLSLELEKIALDKGFVISDNEGSGNCMFHALSEQLNLVKGIKISHRELRQSMVQYLRTNPKLVSLVFNLAVPEASPCTWISCLTVICCKKKKKSQYLVLH